MHVIETIDRLSELALSQPFRRKAEACFLLVSKIAPFYLRYAAAGHPSRTVFDIRDHILFLWSQYRSGSMVSAEHAERLERHLPDTDDFTEADGPVAVYAQNAVVCALHLTWYLARRDDANVRGCVVNYFDHIDGLVLERVRSYCEIRDLADLLVAASRLFRHETSDFEAALLKDEREEIVNRRLLIANMDRDISEFR